jgi:coenzyme F420 hydrogenase subunit beta
MSMNKKIKVEKVVSSGSCSGCGLCASATAPDKIRMILSAEMQYRPTVIQPLSDKELSRFNATCPGVSLAHDVPENSGQVDPIWGSVLGCYTGYAMDPEVRRQGSSGGVITALAHFLLRTGLVDSVSQNVASRIDPTGNEVQFSHGREDVLRAAGSRYGPAAGLSRVEEMLQSGQTFALVGKPCEVAALRSLSRMDERVGQQVPYLLSFMCAGTPSGRGTNALLSAMGISPEEVASFRYRGNGWPGSARAVTHSGKFSEMDYNSSWGTILNRYLQFRCKICPDGTGEFADVVCADAWYGKGGYPDFSERDGRSLILVRTPRGAQLLSDAVSAGDLSIEPLDLGEVAAMQPYQVERKRMVLGRLIAARAAQGHSPSTRRLRLVAAARQASFGEFVRNAVGTFRRAKGE